MKIKYLLAFAVIAAAPLVMGAAEQTLATPPPPHVPTPAPMVGDIVNLPPPNQIVYAPRLPTAAELTSVGVAQGLTAERIVETSTRITVVYRLAGGQTTTIAYELLPTAGVAAAVPAPTPAPPPPRVVYYTPDEPTVYYGGPYYDPWYGWYPPVSVRLGIGYVYHGGGWRSGHRRW